MVLLVLLVLFVVAPIAELAVIVQVAQGIGIPETIALLLLISAAGAWLCKREGLGVLSRIQTSLDRRQLPTRDLADGGLILFAGALLLTPGFLSDVLALLLLLPPTRAVLRAALLAGLARRARRGRTRITVFTAHRGVIDGRFIDGRFIDTTESDQP